MAPEELNSFYATVRRAAAAPVARKWVSTSSKKTWRAIRLFIEWRPESEVCGEASDGVEGIEKSGGLKPELIVLDFSMPRANGLQAAARLQEGVRNTPIIL
jgi:chemotaxis response regulator CheB